MDFEMKLAENQKHTTVGLDESQVEIAADFKKIQEVFEVQFGEHQESFNALLGESQSRTSVNIGDYQTLRGVGIEKIEKTTSEGLVDTYVITLTDKKTFSFTVTNGIVGRDGTDGKDGKDGYTPVKNVDYFDGKDGKDGKDGYTPIKDVDYFDGKDGRDGIDGTDGVGILRVGRSITNGNVDTYVIVLTNGDAYSFTVTNGVDGKDYVLTDKDKADIAKQIGENVDLSDCINEINAVEEFVRGKRYVFKIADTIEELSDFTYDFDFTSNGMDFNQMDYTYYEDDYENRHYLRYRKTDGTYVVAYENGWRKEEYQHILVDNDNTPLGELATVVGTKVGNLEGYESVVEAINELHSKSSEVKETVEKNEENVNSFGKWIDDFCTGAGNVLEGVGDVLEDIGEGIVDAGQAIGTAIANTVKDVGTGAKEAHDWFVDLGKNILGIEGEETPEDLGTMAGEVIAGVVAEKKKTVGSAWKMQDTFDKDDIFEYVFDFTSNGINFHKMRSQVNGTGTYVIHYYYYKNGIELPLIVYSSAITRGWKEEAYQTIYANITAGVVLKMTNIAGASWKLNEELNPYQLSSFRLKCDFIANNVTYKEIRVMRADGIYADNPDMAKYDIDYIEYVRKNDGVVVAVYQYNPYTKTGGWLDSVTGEYNNPQSIYRDITVLAPTHHIETQLSKIGSGTEGLETTSKTYSGGINELYRYMGNLSELEAKEVTPYNMSRSVEDEEEAPEQDTLVKAINRVYRRTVAMQETINELDEKVGESVDTSNLQSKTDETLETNSKEIVGAINESFRKSKQVADIVIPKVIVTDLKDTTWRFNNTMSGFIMARNIKFISNGVTYTQMQAMGDLNSGEYAISYDTTKVYSASTGWIDEAYQNVTYIEGTQLTYSNFINWNNNNGELIKDIALDTEAQTLVEAINELNSKVGGSSSKAIIDVTELPTENINEEAFYRMLTGKWVWNGEVYNSYTCYCVDNLPEVGEVATTDMVTITTYYCVADGVVYGYVDDMLGGYFSIPSGWYSADMLFSVAGIGYGGVVTNMTDTAIDGVLRLLLDYSLYTHKQGKWETLKGVGQAGTGMNAEVFNGILNEAKGDFSHARGRGTVAEGECSSASGRTTLAQGDYSSAEGLETASLGQGTHTEGFGTSAIGDFSHAQGKFNLLDDEGKYAHIVGNGEDGARSNAHTIDWQGNGWFAGTVKVGGTGQDDENAKELATKEYVDSKGGGSADNVASKFTIAVEGNTTVWDVLSATQEAGANLGEWNLINTVGHIQTVIGVIYQPFGNGSFGLLKASNLMKLNTVADVKDWATIPFSDFIDGMFSYPTDEMPQIRFTTANGNDRENSTFYVDEGNPLKLTVEITGGGALQVGDQLQVCKQKRFDGCRANGYKRKFKLQRFVEYVVTEEDLNKRFLTVNIVPNQPKVMHGLFRDGKEASISPLYLRIRRGKGAIQNNGSGQTVDATFSNIVTVWKSHHRSNQAIRIY